MIERPYRIEVYDGARQPLGELDAFTRVELTSRYCQVGAWQLTIPVDAAQSTLLNTTARRRVVVWQAGRASPLLSGPVWRREHNWGETGGGEGALTVAGPDDMWWLRKRLARQVPAQPVNNQTAAGRDVRTGPAETVIRDFVNVNVGPAAITSRRIPGLVLAAGLGRGSTVTGKARMDNLLDLCRALSTLGGVGFRVVLTGADLLFETYVPVDRSADVVISREVGNLRSVSYVDAGPEVTAVTVGGAGEGTLRQYLEVIDGDAETVWDRTEGFTDAAAADTPGLLTQAGTELLASSGPSRTLAIQAMDTPDQVFGRDYYHDVVTVEPLPGVAYVDLVREVTVSWDAETGRSTTSTTGSADATGSPWVVQQLRKLRRRLDEQERSR